MKAAVKDGKIEAYVSTEKDIILALRHGFEIWESEICSHCKGIGRVVTINICPECWKNEVEKWYLKIVLCVILPYRKIKMVSQTIILMALEFVKIVIILNQGRWGDETEDL